MEEEGEEVDNQKEEEEGVAGWSLRRGRRQFIEAERGRGTNCYLATAYYFIYSTSTGRPQKRFFLSFPADMVRTPSWALLGQFEYSGPFRQFLRALGKTPVEYRLPLKGL